MMKSQKTVPPAQWDRVFGTPGVLGIITTADKDGRINAGVFATIVRASHEPVHLSFATYAGKTHTHLNIQETGQFVVNLVQYDKPLLDKVCTVGLEFDRGVNELEKAGLTACTSSVVRPPRIQECNRSFECELVWMKVWVDRVLITGNVVSATVDTDIVDPSGFVDFQQANQALYCGASYFNQPPYEHRFVAARDVMGAATPWVGDEVKRYRKKIDDLKI